MIDIYLAVPYSHPDHDVRRDRFNQVNAFAARLMREGLLVFSPISHTHPIAEYGLPPGWWFWEKFDREFLQQSKAMVALMLPGYEESKGLLAEAQIMAELGRPVLWSEPSESVETIRRWFESEMRTPTV